MKKNIYIVGVGLIGGSFALELKDIFKDSNIIGIDTSKPVSYTHLTLPTICSV